LFREFVALFVLCRFVFSIKSCGGVFYCDRSCLLVSSFVNNRLLARSRPSARAQEALAGGHWRHWPRCGSVRVCNCCSYCGDWWPGGGYAIRSLFYRQRQEILRFVVFVGAYVCSCVRLLTFVRVEYLEDGWRYKGLGYSGAPVGNGIWSRDR